MIIHCSKLKIELTEDIIFICIQKQWQRGHLANTSQNDKKIVPISKSTTSIGWL